MERGFFLGFRTFRFLMNASSRSTIQIHSGHSRRDRCRSRLASILLAVALLFSLSACALTEISPLSKRDELGKLMVERLEWMDEVAHVKKVRSLPVNDPVREAQLLDAMETLGLESGLPAAPVRAFFSGQMEAAKQRQDECLREIALSMHRPKSVPDLAKTIRPALDQIGKKMLTALARARDSEKSSQVIAAAQGRLEKAGYSTAVILPAIQGLEAGLSEK